jgi:hypothetical protein
MAQPLFITPEIPLSFVKTAGEVQLPDDPNAWPAEIMNEVYKQVPYLADFELDVVMDRADAERGFGFGHLEVSNKTEAAATSSPDQLRNAGIKRARIPLIIQEKRLQPLDVIVTEDSQMLPLTESRIRQTVFRPQSFDVTSRTPGDQSMVGQLYPPYRQNYGFGGGGAGGMSGAAKIGSVLAALLKQANVSDLDSFKDEMRDPGMRYAFSINAATYPALEHLASAEPVSVEKTAELLDHLIKPSVLQLTKLADGYRLKVASRHSWAPKSELLDRGDAVRRCGEKVVLAADLSGAVTVPDEEGVAADAAPPAPGAESITTPGLYEVETAEGGTLIGCVIPNLLDIDGRPKPISLFTDGSSSAVQTDIVGTPKGACPVLQGVPAAQARGHGVFTQRVAGEPIATIPFHVKNGVLMPDGTSALLAETFDGRTLTIKVQAHIQTLVPAVDEVAILVPDSWMWLPLDETNEVALASREEDVGKQASAMRALTSVELRGSGYSSFSFRGPAVEKVASDQREFLDQDGALFLLAGLGTDLKYAQTKLAEASRGTHPVLVRVAHSIKTAEELRGEAYVRAEKYLESAPVFRHRLWKEAAVLPDPVAVDTILSLGFINPENVASFISYLPVLEESQRRLCELLVAARLGLKHVPTPALEKCVRSLEEVIEGIKEMAFQE